MNINMPIYYWNESKFYVSAIIKDKITKNHKLMGGDKCEKAFTFIHSFVEENH